jgi:hypothetical protein
VQDLLVRVPVLGREILPAREGENRGAAQKRILQAGGKVRGADGSTRLVLIIPIGWGERQPYHHWRPVNFLTDKAQRDPVSDQTNLKALLCKVSRAASAR